MIDYERLTPAVERAAGIASSSFPAHHEISDVKQSIWVWIMENKGTVTRILADSDGRDAALVQLFVKAANSHLKTEDAAAYCYAEEDQFTYPLDMIKRIFEVVFEHQDWISFAVQLDDQPRARKNPAHGNENLAAYSDVSRAIESLPDDQYNALVWRYKYHYTQAQVGAEFGITQQAASRLLDNATAAVQRFLGKRDLAELRRPSQGPSRPNGGAAARARIERDYEG